ncbi:tetratricopeptide repeat protein [Microcoleus sp. MON2_D5]|uniref:tetratricopeptide repeat protein n=1 Tax=Microcoleus sp. MON2_D5 TaxID=2818833 RepID=UPI002FD53BCC
MQNNRLPSGELIVEKLGINPHDLPAQFPTREQRLQYRAVVQWLTDYKPKSDASNLEKVRGYLEAFYHLCEVEDWKRASEILFTSLDKQTHQNLHNQLGNWGYYLQQIEVYSRILHKLNGIKNFSFLNGLGNAYQALGNYERAMEYNQQALSIALETQDRHLEGIVLVSLGNTYLSQRKFSKTMNCYSNPI